MNDRIGQQIGNYRLIRLLGRGGFADTYLGEHIYLGTQAAIKMLRAQLAQADQENFYTEARTIARLRHPNIVRVLEFGVDNNTPYLVMEYASNETLRQRHPRGKILSSSVVVPYVKQVASALQYAHDQKLVHRDVKPENMLVGENNVILLSDFGIAIIAQTARAQNPQDVAGTVTYMAPEQIQGKPRPASDQYALGVVVYEWLCGMAPFTGTYYEVAIQHERMQPPPLRERVPAIPSDVEQVVMTALAKDPQRRFGSILAFANAFEQACKQSLPSVQPASLYPPADSQISKPTEFAPYPQIPQPYPAEQIPGTAYGAPGSYTPQMTPSAQQGPYTPPPYNDPYAGQLSDYPPPPPPMPSGPQGAYAPSATPPGQPGPLTPFPTPPGSRNAYTPPSTPFVTPATQMQSGLPPIPPTSTAGQKPARRLTTPLLILIFAIVLLFIGGSALTYYTAVYQPNQLHAQATATSVAQVTGTAHANSTSSAQAFATDQAQTNATASVVAQATAMAQATQTALQAIYTQATSGTAAINDRLSAQDSFNWDTFTGSTGGGCSFSGGAFHVATPKGFYTLCDAFNTNFSNFAYQVSVNIISGHSAGLAFRANSTNYSGYIFRIGTDGSYILEKIVSTGGNTNHTTMVSGNSPAITSGNNQSNQLAVVVRGNTFYLYVNQQYVDQASDSAYQSGQIGAYANSDSSGGSEGVFSNAEVWKL